MPKSTSALVITIVIIALFPISAFSAGNSKTVRVQRITRPPRIDGRLNDECWESARAYAGFYQYDPRNGARASEETIVKVTYDKKNIYFAFMMKDSMPEKIWAELTPRNQYQNNDAITVVLDTYNDKRTSFSFTVNPRGIQKNSVETIWRSGARILKDGWSAEMAIPFKSLRFSAENIQTWGVNFSRYIHRLNEQDYWTDVNRDQPLLQQMGALIGLEGIRPGYNLEIFPYTGMRSTSWNGQKDEKFAIGVDLKYGILPNVILDLSASPDFSEVESDPFIYQRTPYANYFNENRPFFSEGSQYFRLATEEEYSWQPSIQLFYTRRIDKPKIAGKLSGKIGGYSFGVLGALNEEEAGDNFYTVVRLQKDIFKNSQIGFYYAGSRVGDDYNRNVAIDYNFNFKDVYYIQGVSAFSFSKHGETGNNGMHVLRFQRQVDAGLTLNYNFERIEENVDVRTGFINKRDVQKMNLDVGWAWRFNRGAIKRFSIDFAGYLHQDSHGNTTGYTGDIMYWAEFLSRFQIHGYMSVGRRRYQVLENGSLVWTRDYIPTLGGDFFDFSWERGGFLKEASLELGIEEMGIYNQDFTSVEPGKETRMELELILRPLSNLELAIAGNWIRQTLNRTGGKVFDGITYSGALHYQLTRKLFFNLRLLGETREDQYNLDFLAGYYFGAGNTIQLIYKKSQRKEGLDLDSGYSIILKISYLFRL